MLTSCTFSKTIVKQTITLDIPVPFTTNTYLIKTLFLVFVNLTKSLKHTNLSHNIVVKCSHVVINIKP